MSAERTVCSYGIPTPAGLKLARTTATALVFLALGFANPLASVELAPLGLWQAVLGFYLFT